MKIIVEADEQEIIDEAKEKVADWIAKKLEQELFGRNSISYHFHNEVREITREILKSHYDELAKEAVDAAAVSLSNRAIKSKISKILEE